MQDNKKLTDDDFYNKYTCLYNQIKQAELNKDDDNGQLTIADMAPYDGCMYETYGSELDYVRGVVYKNPKTVWTIIDNNDGWYGIVAGYHWVNRQGYLITEQEWENEYEEYTIYDSTELREQWDSLPKEAIMIICDIEYIGDTPEELQWYKDENFYKWEEISEEIREEIMNKFKSGI